jgi:uroporphyrinogen III methyltransferase / synthase
LPEGIAKLDTKLAEIDRYHWLILTSVNSVVIVSDLMKTWNLPDLKIACIGPATARKVEEFGGRVTLVPDRYRAEELSEVLIAADVKGTRILLPRAAGSRPVLPDALTTAGAQVDEIHIYKADVASESREKLAKFLLDGEIDLITFTSSSTVRNFADLAADLPWKQIRTACIGPITAQTLREHGIEPRIIATEFTIPGLVTAICNYFETTNEY